NDPVGLSVRTQSQLFWTLPSGKNSREHLNELIRPTRAHQGKSTDVGALKRSGGDSKWGVFSPQGFSPLNSAQESLRLCAAHSSHTIDSPLMKNTFCTSGFSLVSLSVSPLHSVIASLHSATLTLPSSQQDATGLSLSKGPDIVA
ncbi:unnamed protein product, partial [Pleuronectes platessa]